MSAPSKLRVLSVADGAPCACTHSSYVHDETPHRGEMYLAQCFTCDCSRFTLPTPPTPREVEQQASTAALKAVAAVLAMHHKDAHGHCEHCDAETSFGQDHVAWPCATVSVMLAAGVKA